MNTNKVIEFSIPEAAKYMKKHEHYVRKLHREGKLASTKRPIGTSKILKVFITKDVCDAWLAKPRTHVSRADGRSKFIAYLNAEEVAALKAYEINKAPVHKSKKVLAAKAAEIVSEAK